MTEATFRSLALSLPEVLESEHMKHPDFRVHGKIFATLRYPTADWGMVKLSPAQQERFVKKDPEAFVPVKGAWGRQGSTSVKLKAAKKEILRDALASAWANIPSKPAKKK